MAVNVRQLSNVSPTGVNRAPAGEVGQIPEGPPERVRSLADFETLLEQDRPERVVATLEPAADPSGAAHALMGIAFFRLERYGEAAAQLRLAIDRGRSDPQLQSLLDRAVANELTGVARAVPARTYLDEAAAPAGPRPGQQPQWIRLPGC